MYNPQTYVTGNISVPSGVAAAVAQPLTYSQNSQRQMHHQPSAAYTTSDFMVGSAFPERGHQTVYAVEGIIQVEPSAWALGNFIRFGWRLAIMDMDPVDTSALIVPEYSMYTSGTNVTIAQSANTGFLAEGRLFRIAGDGERGHQMMVRWSSSKGIRLGNDRALYLYMEGATDSVSLRVRPYVRTLMRAP